MEPWIQTATTYVLPILGAAIAGGLIGMEREYRGRPAGLRTHILVSLSCALLMLAAVHQVHWLTDTPHDVIRIDPVRMAHGILTGIGFLCGGVIFRQGLTVHGLTTAASLWTTSALGILYGVGFYGLALGGTVATVVILAGLRWVEAHMPRIGLADLVVRYGRQVQDPEGELKALAKTLNLEVSALSHKLVQGGEFLELGAALHSRGATPTDALARRLCADPRVVEFEIAPRKD